jgi:hypothetical protein
MSNNQLKPIGGYFELELPKKGVGIFDEYLKFQSARAALQHFLNLSPEIEKVWVPLYVCDAVIDAIRAAKKDISFYSINENFELAKDLLLLPHEILLYVNYFGVCDEIVNVILEKYNSKQVIIDYSQAIYSPTKPCLAAIYSPRKFFGIPDGGLLKTIKKNITAPNSEDRYSIHRMKHLVLRIATSERDGYRFYLRSEASLANKTPQRMSKLTREILDSIQFKEIMQKRMENFNYIANRIGGQNNLNVTHKKNVSALCYPYIGKKIPSRDDLAAKKIYLPVYWKEVKNRVKRTSFEYLLAEHLLPIPCDQRYEICDLERLLEELGSGI